MTKYLPPHYHKLEVPSLKDGDLIYHIPKYFDGNQMSILLNSTTYNPYEFSNTPDYIYDSDNDKLLSQASNSSKVISSTTTADTQLVSIDKYILNDLFLKAYYHTGVFNIKSDTTLQNSTQSQLTSNSADNNPHDSNSTENSSSTPEYFVATKGDTLWKIAKKYHTTVDAIVEANKDKPTEPGFAQIKDKDLIYAGASYYLPADAYIDTSGTKQNSSSTNTQNDNDQFCLIGSENDPLRFFRTSEEINLAQKASQKQTPSQSIEHSPNIESDSSQSLLDVLPEIINNVCTPITNIVPSDLSDFDLVINKADLYSLVYKYFFHFIEPEHFNLDFDINLQMLSDTFNCPISSIVAANSHLLSNPQQEYTDIENIIIPKSSTIYLPIEYNINEDVSSLEDVSSQNEQLLPIPNYTNINFNSFTRYVQPRADSRSLADLKDGLTTEDLINTFQIPEQYIYYLYDYLNIDPTITADDKYVFNNNSNRLFQCIDINSNIESSYADLHVDFHFISSPWLKKHLRPNVYKGFMYAINLIANRNYNLEHSAYSYVSNPFNDQSIDNISIQDLDCNDIPIDNFSRERQKAIFDQVFDPPILADSEPK